MAFIAFPRLQARNVHRIAPHQSKLPPTPAPYASTDVDATSKTDQLLRPCEKLAGADMQMPPRGFEEDMRRSYSSVVGQLDGNSLPSCSSSQGLPLHPPSSLPSTQVTENAPAHHNTKLVESPQPLNSPTAMPIRYFYGTEQDPNTQDHSEQAWSRTFMAFIAFMA